MTTPDPLVSAVTAFAAEVAEAEVRIAVELKDRAPDSLLAAIRAVPMRCMNEDHGSAWEQGCIWETDDLAIARAVRAWLRRVEPSEWEIADVLDGIGGSPNVIRDLRDLYRRAWEKMP